MQDCSVTITTSADGRETTMKREGSCQLSVVGCMLQYREENAAVRILLNGEAAEVERMGDYTLRLYLKRGETTIGYLGIGGSEGEIGVVTHKVAYSIGKDSLLLALQYDLLMNGETQKMKLRIYARMNKGEQA